MRVSCLPSLPILLLSGFFAVALNAGAAAPFGLQPPYKAPIASPQIVRLSYVEGDVRVSRGKLAEKEDAKADETATGWEQAVSGLPMESGYSLVTGKGRAEIEFEDASTVYVGENSVLTFGELSATSGVPYSEMALLSGVATLNVHTEFPGEFFRMNTPTDHVTVQYPQHSYMRINSYLDSVALTPFHSLGISDAKWYEPRAESSVAATHYYSNGMRQIPPKGTDATTFIEWDAWVDKRVRARDEAIAATMKDAGLSAPIPGLAEMSGQGHFFACVPYGTCWEPSNGWNVHASNVALVTVKPEDTAAQSETTQAAVPQAVNSNEPRPNVPAIKAPKPTPSEAYLAAHPGATLRTEDYFIPCTDYPIRDTIATDPVTGKEKVIDSMFDTAYQSNLMGTGFGYIGRRPGLFMNVSGGPYGAPWDWAVCHAGTWIRWHRHYAWVAGTHRHHHGPYRWVKYSGRVGFVPMHPHDVTGKPPVNLKDGLFQWKGKRDGPVEKIALEDGKSLKLLDTPPKEFRVAELEPLKTADVPHAEGHEAYRTTVASRNATTGKVSPSAASNVKGTSITALGVVGRSELKDAGTPITFDRRTQSFMLSRQSDEGRGPVMSSQPLGGHGMTYQEGNSNSQTARNWNGQASRPSSNAGYSNNNATRSTSSASYSNNNSRSYTPPPSSNNSYSAARSSQPSTPAPSYSPPAPSYSPPSSSGSSSAQPAHH